MIVSGELRTKGYEITRPANTTAYTAGDVVSDSTTATTPIPLEVSGRNGGTGYIMRMRLITDQSTCTAQFRVWVYSVSNMTLAADNAAFTLLYANKANRLGSIDLPAMATGTGTSNSASAMVPSSTTVFAPFPYQCAPTDNRLYFVLETRSGFTPASGQKFYLEVTTDVNS